MRALHVTIAFTTWHGVAEDAKQIRRVEENFLRRRLSRVLNRWAGRAREVRAKRLKLERQQRIEAAKKKRVETERCTIREEAEARKREGAARKARMETERKSRHMDERHRRMAHTHHKKEEERQRWSETERRKKEQLATALLTRALNSRDAVLMEEAVAAAGPFPSLRDRCNECQELLRQMTIELIGKARESGDIASIARAQSLAQKRGLSAEASELMKWKQRVLVVRNLIASADRSGDARKIDEAVLAARGLACSTACFDQQVRALQQMKALLADVHLLLNQALERRDPDDIT